MPIITDHFTLQGHSLAHLEHGCQDYAFSFTSRDGDIQIAIVSDGCSSAPNSDVGARMLVLFAGRTLQDFFQEDVLFTPDLSAEELARQLEMTLVFQLETLYNQISNGSFLGPLLLDCTLNIAVRYKDHLFVLMYGDGYVCIDYLDGGATLVRCENTAVIEGVRRSAPNYLAYKLPTNAGRLAAYRAGQPVTEIDAFIRLSGGTWNPQPVHSEQPDDGRPYAAKFDFSKIRSVVVSSDGIGTFEPDKTRLLEDIVDDTMRFPAAAKGSILRRKLLFNSTRTWPKRGWKHQDDLGMAGILRQ